MATMILNLSQWRGWRKFMARRILVCGGRDFGDMSIPRDSPFWFKRKAEYQFIHKILSDLFPVVQEDESTWLPPSDVCIISGKARGVDTAAIDWAVINWTAFEEYPADWKKYGKSAGYIRNKQMLEEGKPDLVIAFPGGRGTAMMVGLARNAGVEVIEVKYG